MEKIEHKIEVYKNFYVWKMEIIKNFINKNYFYNKIIYKIKNSYSHKKLN